MHLKVFNVDWDPALDLHIHVVVSCFFSVCAAIDLTHGAVYCYSCGDYVYDHEFEAIAKEEKTKAAKFVGKSKDEMRNTGVNPYSSTISVLGPFMCTPNPRTRDLRLDHPKDKAFMVHYLAQGYMW